MSNKQNDILREQLYEQAQEIVQMMIDDKEIHELQRDVYIDEIYSQLYAEKDISIETEMDDNSGDDY